MSRQRMSEPKRLGEMPPQGIDHQVANHVNPLGRNPFAQQIAPSAFFRHQKQVRNGISGHTINFLRDGSVETAQPGFIVDNRDAELTGRQCRRNRRI